MDPQHLKSRLRDALHSAVLILGMALLAALCAFGLWGWSGMFAVFAGVVLGSTLAPSLPLEVILRAWRARPLARHELPDAFAATDALSMRAGLPAAPGLWYVPTPRLLAFTLGGPSQAAIVLSDGLVRLLAPRELTAVIAHEIGHVRNNDLRIMALADMLSRMARTFANVGLLLLVLNIPLAIGEHTHLSWTTVFLLIVSPTIAALLQLALSRTREFEADMAAAELSGDPEALISALMKMERAEGSLWESLFPGRRLPDLRLFRTHPLTRERVLRLRRHESGHPPASMRGRRRPLDRFLLPFRQPPLQEQRKTR